MTVGCSPGVFSTAGTDNHESMNSKTIQPRRGLRIYVIFPLSTVIIAAPEYHVCGRVLDLSSARMTGHHRTYTTSPWPLRICYCWLSVLVPTCFIVRKRRPNITVTRTSCIVNSN